MIAGDVTVQIPSSKRQKTAFGSDYITDEALELLLDVQHFSVVSSRSEPQLIVWMTIHHISRRKCSVQAVQLQPKVRCLE